MLKVNENEEWEKRPGNATPRTVEFLSAGIVRAIATEAGSSVS
jgi:hypothetical protein